MQLIDSKTKRLLPFRILISLLLIILCVVSCTKKESTKPSLVSDNPVARFHIIPVNNSFHAEDTLMFDASDSYDPQSDSITYEWNFGDSAYCYDKICIHSYGREGYYTVTLIVSDSKGYADTCATGLNILPPFARAYIESIEVVETDTLPRYFRVTVGLMVKHYPSPWVYLNLGIREADGHRIAWLLDERREIHVDSDPFSSSEEFTYGLLSGAPLWPLDSAMVIASLWRDTSQIDTLTLLDINTVIAHYPR